MASTSEVLLVTDLPTLPSSIIMWATRTYGDRVLGSTALTVLTDFLQTGGKLDVETSTVEVVISLAETPGFHNWTWLLEVGRILKNGGNFWIQEPLISRNFIDEEHRRLGTTPAQDKANLERSLLLAGFVNIEMEEPMYGVGLSSEFKVITSSHISSIYGPLLKPFAIKGNKPMWDSRSTFAIKKKVAYDHHDYNQQDYKQIYASPIVPRHSEHRASKIEKDHHIEAIVQTDTKIYRDVNVSTQIIRDRNDRYDPYHYTYDQQTEVMVQTDNVSKDILAGGDTPLPTSRGLSKIITSNQYNQKSLHEEPQLKPHKQTFKLDLSSVCTNEDQFEPIGDDEEVLTEEDTPSSYHEPQTPIHTCRGKTPCRYCSSQPYEFEERQQQTEYPPWGSRRGHTYTDSYSCSTCAKSNDFLHLEEARLWLKKYPYKLCQMMAIKIYNWCLFEGKLLYKEMKIFTTYCLAKLQQLIIKLTPYVRSFIASSSSWPIVGLFLPNSRHKSIQVDKATQAYYRSRRPSCLHPQEPADIGFTF